MDVFDLKVKNMFNVMKAEWGVPFEVINDGEVTALAGTMSLGAKAMLGVAMGSSQAGGFLNADGHIPGWLDELAFAPLDASPAAVADEWSGDRGVGANYFSQQAVNKLALRAGIPFPDDMRLPERLKHVQALAGKEDANALRVFADIGIYLGYTVPFYEMFYDYRNLLVLGRVMSGVGGDIIMETAGKILRRGISRNPRQGPPPPARREEPPCRPGRRRREPAPHPIREGSYGDHHPARQPGGKPHRLPHHSGGHQGKGGPRSRACHREHTAPGL